MRVLCVAEKPSIARSVSQILSGGQFTTRPTSNKYIKNYEFDYPQTNSSFTVTSVSGHLMTHDFSTAHRSWHSCDPFDLFDAAIEKQVAPDKKSIEKNLIQEAKRAQMLMIWTDCDREGENIGEEVSSVCRRANRNITVRRARFSAIIAQQIHHAAQNPVQLDMGQVQAVEARTILDLRLGAAFTRMQTLKLQQRFGERLKEVVSYGPCQFPTLGFVVSRFNQVKAFVPEPFWYIFLSVSRQVTSKDRQEITFTWRRGHLFDLESALRIYEVVLANPRARVSKVTNKDTKKWKPLPLTTVELQKSGSRLLKLAPKKILDISEKLYQQGFLSYPRTETDQFDPQFDFMSLIQKQTADPAWGDFATSLQGGGFGKPRNGKKNDQAHPPIHPTAHVVNLAGDEKRVYEFITRRFLACCSKDALGYQTTIDVICGNEEFYATGLIVLERNYLEVYPYDKWSTHELPNFQEGETFMPSVCELREGETTRPTLLTEADLVNLMDKNGIGTDATIAQHIQTIVDRGYVIERMDGSTKHLVPSTLGIGLVDGYNDIDFERSLSKPQLRRETEWNMVQVCDGLKTKNDMLEQAINQYKDIFMRARNEFGKVITSVQRRLEGGGGGGGGDNGGGNNGDDEHGRGGGGGGRGRRGGRGRGAARGGGRGSSRNNAHTSDPSDDDDGSPPAPVPRNYSKQTKTVQTAKPRSKPVPPPPPPPPQPIAPSTSKLQCKCNSPAKEVLVLRDGPSNGKKYWTCGNNQNCDYFQWSDGPSSEAVKVIPAKRLSSGAMVIGTCLCKLEAKRDYTKKEGANFGRRFLACSKPRGDASRCKFFEWDDEEPIPGQNGSGSSGSGGTFGRNVNGASSVAEGSGGANDCYRCGKPGHWAKECRGDGPSEPKRSRSLLTKDGTASSGACFRCGEEGHWSARCPNPGSKPSYDPKPNSSRSEPAARPTKSRSVSSTGGGKGGKSGRMKKSKFDAADGY